MKSLVRSFVSQTQKVLSALYQQTATNLSTVENPEFSKQTSIPRNCIRQITRNDKEKMLVLDWADGRQSRYPYMWLRDNAQASHTMNLTNNNRARILLMGDLDTKSVPTSVKLSELGDTLSLDWKESGESKSVSFSSDWLRRRDISHPDFVKSRQSFYLKEYQTWDSAAIKEEVKEPADFDRLMREDSYLADQLSRLLRLGFLHVKNVGPSVGAERVEQLTDRVGYLANTHHGRFFTVRKLLDPFNLDKTSHKLGLHTDQPQMGYPPQTQILHCLNQAGRGGENQFSDGFQVAEQIRTERPDVFRTLTDTLVEYVDWGKADYRFQMAQAWPVIRLDDKGKYEAIYFNNQIRSWFFHAPVEQYNNIYDALKTFNDYCYQPRNMFQIQLKPGEMAWFSNNRVMHARSAFEAGGDGGERHYEGSFINFDAIRSKIRVIRSNENPDNYHPSW
jgi:gamma-butyrobetaine dioxygenase